VVDASTVSQLGPKRGETEAKKKKGRKSGKEVKNRQSGTWDALKRPGIEPFRKRRGTGQGGGRLEVFHVPNTARKNGGKFVCRVQSGEKVQTTACCLEPQSLCDRVLAWGDQGPKKEEKTGLSIA